MWFITADSGQKRPQPTAWSHEAMLVQVIDLGTQPWSQAYPDPKRKIELMFEILDENGDFNWEQKPFAVWQYTSPYISYDASKITNYHKLINQLFWSKNHEEAKAVDFGEILWDVYMIQLVDNNWYTNIESLTRWTTKMQAEYKDHTTHNPQIFFTLEDFNLDVFEQLSEKKQEKIKSSPEYINATKLKDGGDFTKKTERIEEDFDDLPFS